MNLSASLRLLALAALCASPQLQAAPAAAPADTGAVTVQTRPGAMVSRIAAAHRPAGATQDQTLLAILRANPDAFMGANINLLMKGATLTIPPAAQVLATPADEARRLIQQQHADYARHGQALAHRVPAAGAAVATAPAAAVAAPSVAEGAAVAAHNGANNSGAVASGVADNPNARVSGMAGSSAAAAASTHAQQSGAAHAGASAAPAGMAASAMAVAPAASAAASAAEAASAASAVVAPALPASEPTLAGSAVPTSATASEAGFTLSSLREHGPLFGSIMVIVGLVGWGIMRSARKRREEEEQLAAAAAAEPAPRPAAEALARAMDDSVEVPPGDLEPAAPEAVRMPQAVGTAAAAASATVAAPVPQPAEDLSALSLDLNELHAADDAAPAPRQPVPFDFSSISLELDEPAAGAPGGAALQTRLALAREFLAIDDLDGARVLAQEVARHGSAEQQAEAQALLQRIDGSSSGSA